MNKYYTCYIKNGELVKMCKHLMFEHGHIGYCSFYKHRVNDIFMRSYVCEYQSKKEENK